MKKIYLISIIVVILIIMFISTFINEKEDINYNFENIHNLDDKTIIDVRTTEEYESGHIKDSINIPLDEIETISLNKNEVIFVYCAGGVRSESAMNILINLGYEEVYDLGGIDNKNLILIK